MTAFLTPLAPSALRGAEIPEPWSFGMADRVRFHEIDAQGHVNNVVFLRWFETLRVRYFGAYDVTKFGPSDPNVVLFSQDCTYLAPMFLDEAYIVTARCESFRNTSFVKNYAVWRDGKICAKGNAICVLTDKAGQKVTLSDEIKSTFSERDGAVAAS